MKATGDEVRGEGNQRVGRVPGSLGSMHREKWGRKDQPQEGRALFQTGRWRKGMGTYTRMELSSVKMKKFPSDGTICSIK